MLLIGKLLQVGSSSSRFGHWAVPAGHVTIVLLGKNIYKSPCMCGCANLQSACAAQLYAGYYNVAAAVLWYVPKTKAHEDVSSQPKKTVLVPQPNWEECIVVFWSQIYHLILYFWIITQFIVQINTYRRYFFGNMEWDLKSSVLDPDRSKIQDQHLDPSMFIQCYSVPTGRVSTLMIRPPSSNSSSLDIDTEVAEINNNISRR